MEEMEREKEPWEGPSAAEFLLLDQKARAWASQKIRNSTGAELAADKAMAYLLDRCLRGDLPRKPFAWLKTAIDTLATKLKQGRKGMGSLDEGAFREVFAIVDSLPYQLNPPEEREWLEQARKYLESIREELEKLLKEHQILKLKWIFLGTLILAPIASTALNDGSDQEQAISVDSVQVHYEATFTDAMPAPKVADIEILFKLYRNGDLLGQIGWYEYDSSPVYESFLLSFKDDEGNLIELDDQTDSVKVQTGYWPKEDHRRGGHMIITK